MNNQFFQYYYISYILKNIPSFICNSKLSWRRKWQPTPVFWPGKSHGQRSQAGYNTYGPKELDTTKHTHECTRTHMQLSYFCGDVSGLSIPFHWWHHFSFIQNLIVCSINPHPSFFSFKVKVVLATSGNLLFKYDFFFFWMELLNSIVKNRSISRFRLHTLNENLIHTSHQKHFYSGTGDGQVVKNV